MLRRASSTSRSAETVDAASSCCSREFTATTRSAAPRSSGERWSGGELRVKRRRLALRDLGRGRRVATGASMRETSSALRPSPRAQQSGATASRRSAATPGAPPTTAPSGQLPTPRVLRRVLAAETPRPLVGFEVDDEWSGDPPARRDGWASLVDTLIREVLAPRALATGSACGATGTSWPRPTRRERRADPRTGPRVVGAFTARPRPRHGPGGAGGGGAVAVRCAISRPRRSARPRGRPAPPRRRAAPSRTRRHGRVVDWARLPLAAVVERARNHGPRRSRWAWR